MSKKDKKKEKRIIQIELGTNGMDYMNERLAYFLIPNGMKAKKLEDKIESKILDCTFSGDFDGCKAEQKIVELFHVDHLYTIFDHIEIDDEIYDISVEVEQDGKRYDFYFNNNSDIEKEIKIILYQDGEMISSDASQDLYAMLDDIESGKIEKYAFFYGGDFVCNIIHPSTANIMKKEVGLINQIVLNAVIDGANASSTYQSNGSGLTQALSSWIKEKELNGYYVKKVEVEAHDSLWSVLQIVHSLNA